MFPGLSGLRGRSSKHSRMRGSRKFSQRGSKLDTFFLVDEGIEDPVMTINGPSTAASETPFKWRFAGGPMMTQH